MNVSALKAHVHHTDSRVSDFCYLECVKFGKQTFFLLGFSEKS